MEDVPEGSLRCGACGFVRLPSAVMEQTRGTPELSAWVKEILTAARTIEKGAYLLEIGCGDGERLEQARTLGFQVMGVESRAQCRQNAQQRLPGVYIAETLEQLPPHNFNFVLISGTLESEPDIFGFFYTLFKKAVIIPETSVILELPASYPGQAALNIFSERAVEELFQVLNFSSCTISKVTDIDATSRIRCVAKGSNFIEFMHERYVPGTWSELTGYEHLPRYDYACRLAAGGNVLDFGCGTGYGSRWLASVACEVLAVDIDETALDYARSTQEAENLHFLRNADLAASLESGSFDLITCFEVIEHIPSDQQAELVKNFARLLKPNGVLLISTPNPAVTALYGENPYHLHEMRLEEFRALVGGAFPYVQIFLQNICASVYLQDENLPPQGELILNSQVFEGSNNAAIYVAACANAPLPAMPSVVYPDTQHDFIAQHMSMLHLKNQSAGDRVALVQQESENTILRNKLAAVETERRGEQELWAEIAGLATKLREVELRNADITVRLRAVELEQSVLRQNEVELERERAALHTARTALHTAKVQSENLQLRLEQIEHSTSWRVLRRARPLLSAMRPVLRPPLRLAYRAYRRLNSRPIGPLLTPADAGPINPVSRPLNLMLELRLEPVWNETAGRYDLECDKRAPSQNSEGWVQPYHVVPFHREGPAETRILHIIPNVFVGGSTQLVIDLVQNLPRSYEHVVLTAALWQGGAHTGIEVHHVPAPDPEALAHVLDKVRPDMVHMHYWGLTDESWYQAVLKTLRGRGVPAVQNVNTPIAPLVDPVFSAYVFVSQYVLDHFGEEAMASGAVVRVIHPGIDLNRFEGQDIAPDAQNAIGMVYRLEHDKLNEDNIELLIEVVRRRPRTRAYVVGGGSLLQPYLERTEQAGVRENFRFTGYVPYASLPDWYKKFRIFVAPVWKESFGQVAPFAMSKGCVVTGYDIGALAEIVGGHETLGHSLGETVDIIVDLLDDPERLLWMGTENHRRARELFGLPKMIERYAEVYDLMLAR